MSAMSTGYFDQDFYHALIIPLVAATAVLAFVARPSTSDELPQGFPAFLKSYLSVWALCVAADWLQGPYVYALYARYGFPPNEIAQLFVVGFGSSLVFGAAVGALLDKFGRKKCCICYCILYIASCLTKHFRHYGILMIGRVTGGIATSMLFSCFECWMVSEHVQRHKFSGKLLGFMFGLMFTVMYIVAIISGIVGQTVNDSFQFQPIFGEGGIFHVGGETAPFDAAIICLLAGMALILPHWEENYGNKPVDDLDKDGGTASELLANFFGGMQILSTDVRTLLVGLVVSCFEGSMYTFVFNWTPALRSTTTPPPHGVIFALFMMSCMCGASVSTLVGGIIEPSYRLIAVFAMSTLSFFIASNALSMGAENHLGQSLFAFLLFEFCVGLYFPTIGVLKSEIVPEDLRGTIYNLYRVPLNAIVVGMLLSNINIDNCFKLNAILQILALVGTILIMVLSKNKPSQPKEAPECDIEDHTDVGKAKPTVLGAAE